MRAGAGWVLAGGLSLVGCGAADPGADFAKPDRRLEGTSWRMESLGGEPVQAPMGSAEKPTLTFKNGFATWTVGCNGFDALYRTENDRLSLQSRPKKRVGGCEAFERPIEAALGGEAMPFRRLDRSLTIMTPDGPLELRRTNFEAARVR